MNSDLLYCLLKCFGLAESDEGLCSHHQHRSCCLAVDLWYVWKGKMITSVWSGICCAGAKLLSHFNRCHLQMINAQPQAKINTLKYHHIATITPHAPLKPHMFTSFIEQCCGPLRSPQCLSGFSLSVSGEQIDLLVLRCFSYVFSHGLQSDDLSINMYHQVFLAAFQIYFIQWKKLHGVGFTWNDFHSEIC